MDGCSTMLRAQIRVSVVIVHLCCKYVASMYVARMKQSIYSFGSQTRLAIEAITCEAVEYRVLSHV